MQTDRYDWVMVEVAKVGEAVRKIAVDLLDADDEQIVDINQQTDTLLEDTFDHSRIALVDAHTAAMILRPPQRIREYARLLAHKAQLLDLLGDPDNSESMARRALELQLESTALEHNPDKHDHEAIDALLERDPPLRLRQRHLELLDKLDADT